MKNTVRECEHNVCDNQCELSEVVTPKYKKSWTCNFKTINKRYTCQLYKPIGADICLKCGYGICDCDEL